MIGIFAQYAWEDTLKKILLCFCFLGALALVENAYAIESVPVACVGTSTCQEASGCNTILTPIACGLSGYTTTYYDKYVVNSCISCPTGYELVSKSVTVPGCSNKVFYKDCARICSGCDNCESTDWKTVSGASGYQSKIDANCNYSTCTCEKKVSYRCNQGYYGTANGLGTSGCTQCPFIDMGKAVELGGGLIPVLSTRYGMTPAAGNGYAITDCYAPHENVIYSDTKGEYTFSDDCYWSNLTIVVPAD